MIERNTRPIVHWLLIVMITAVMASYGIYLASKPIDAVPDITNNQVAINIEVPSLSPFEVEKQVTYPIETAMAGIPGFVLYALDFTQWLRASYGNFQGRSRYLLRPRSGK